MDQRRYMMFILVTMGFFLVWMQVAPFLFPQFFPKGKPKKPAVVQNDEDGGAQAVGEQDVDLGNTSAEVNAEPADNVEAEQSKLEIFPSQTVVLGESGFDDGYLLQAKCTSQGGAVEWVQLTDERYTTLDRTEQLKVIGNPVDRNVGNGRTPNTFETSLLQIDEQLAKQDLSLRDVDWEIVEQTNDSVTFRYPAPDGSLEVLKTYTVSKSDPTRVDEDPAGYLLHVEVEVVNKSDKIIETAYQMQGPVGLPLENVENTYIYREFKVGSLEDGTIDDVTAINLTADAYVDQFNKEQNGGKAADAWRQSLHYVGVDVQLFAALIMPSGNQIKDDYFDVVYPQLIHRDGEHQERSDISILLESKKLECKPGSKVTHEFDVFLGPKRDHLLQPLNAGDVISFGWFGFIAKAMLNVLGFFHAYLGLPYAFAIILLTVCVRGAMFPISKRQVIEAEKMKVLAPELTKIREKHKDKPEEFAKAYREFQKKNNYHPMVGCLPALLQMPIFIGLYRSLFYAVDLRLSKFLWVDNLAAPDALFNLGFAVPFLGWTQFNLLPILTVGLMFVQQKMFAPPAETEEQQMQQNMMGFFMIMMLAVFYKSPAGLCVYFIASSLWGVVERMILKNHTPEPKKTVVAKADTDTEEKPRSPSILERIQQAADQARNATEGQVSQKKNKKKGPKKR